jgi:hypothetical protein
MKTLVIFSRGVSNAVVGRKTKMVESLGVRKNEEVQTVTADI